MLSLIRSNIHRRGRWPILVALAVFMLVKGFAPAGYMLTDGSGPGLYILCHGYIGSAQLLQFASNAEHAEKLAHAAHERRSMGTQSEQHQDVGHELTSHQAKQNMCLYSAIATVAFVAVIVVVLLLAAPVVAVFFYTVLLPRLPARFLPAARAPPLASIAY